jgi:hypothetical protein
MGGFKASSTTVVSLNADDLEVDSGTLSVDATNNRIGIGLTTPKTELTVEGTITLKEAANASSDTAAYGQLWVKSDAPCNLYFTDDTGQDVAITSDGSLASSGGSLSGLGSTDNVILRANGTGGQTAQGSGISVDDSDNTSGMGTLGCGAITSTGALKIGSAAGSGVDAFLYTAGTAAHVGIQWDADGNTEGTLIGGADDHGVDFKFFGETSGRYIQWDMSGDELVLAAASKISFHDAAGGENIVASSNGHLEINSGTTLDMTAPTVDVNASTAVTIDTPGVTITDTTATSATEGGFLRLAADDGAAMADDHRLGVIEFAGAEDANSTITVGAKIEAICDAGWSATENGTALVMSTTDGNASQSEVLRLDSDKLATLAGDLTVSGADVIIGGDSDGTDRTVVFGHSTLKTIMGIDDSADAFVINTDAAFDGTLANNSFSIDASHNAIIAGNLTLGGKLTGPLELEQASDGGGTALLIDNDDTDQIAINVEAANIDANVVNITADTLTTSTGISLSADALTTGKGIDVSCSSNSLNGGSMISATYSGTSTNNQAVLKLHNDHASATGTSMINMDQDSTGPLIHATYGAFGSAIQLKVAEQEVTLTTDSTTHDVSSFFPAGSVPISVAGRVTVALTNNAFVTKIGTDGDDDMFAASSFGDGQIESAGATFVFFPNNSGTTVFPSADTLRITTNANPTGGGKIRVTLYYWQITAPTS